MAFAIKRRTPPSPPLSHRGVPSRSHTGQYCKTVTHPRGSLQGPLWDKAVTHGGIFKVHYGTKLSLTGVPSRSLMRQNCSGWGSLQPFRCLDMYPKMIFNQLYMHEKENCIFENSMKMISLMNYLCTRLPLQ